MEAGAAELALVPGIWEGTLECGRGTTYVTMSTDIHPFNGVPNSAAAAASSQPGICRRYSTALLVVTVEHQPTTCDSS